MNSKITSCRTLLKLNWREKTSKVVTHCRPPLQCRRYSQAIVALRSLQFRYLPKCVKICQRTRRIISAVCGLCLIRQRQLTATHDDWRQIQHCNSQLNVPCRYLPIRHSVSQALRWAHIVAADNRRKATNVEIAKLWRQSDGKRE